MVLGLLLSHVDAPGAPTGRASMVFGRVTLQPTARAQPPRGDTDAAVRAPDLSGVMTDVECVDLPACRAFGWCSEMGAVCAARTDDDCLSSEACASSGSCRAFRGVCVPAATSSSDCHVPRGAAYVNPCADLGLCDAVDGVCFAMAQGDADCRSNVMGLPDWSPCSAYGGCEAQGGVCVAGSDAQCRTADICAEEGRCAVVGGWCRAASTEGCAASEACVERGECHPIRGSCLASLESCLRLSACFESDVNCQVDGGGRFGHCYWPGDPFTF